MLTDTIKKVFIDAYKAKQTTIADTLKMLKSAIQYKEIEYKTKNLVLADQDVIDIIKMEIKKRKESIEQFQNANRYEMAQQEQQEIAVLGKYLPASLSFEEVKEKVHDIISQMDEATDFGHIMKKSMATLKGTAEGIDIKKAIEDFLNTSDKSK